MKRYIAALLLGSLLVSLGCAAPDRVRGHILQPTDRTLPTYSDNLVILDVRVETQEGALKLYDVDLRETDSGLNWRVPLFANSIMKTKAITFEEKDGAIYHTAVLDLPAGNYEVLNLEFRNFIGNFSGPNVAQTYARKPPEPVFFTVVNSGQPQYLGRLNVSIDPYVTSQVRDGTSQAMGAAHEVLTSDNEITDAGGTDAMLGAAASAMATDVQTLSGSIAVSVTAPDAASATAAGKRFRALSGTTVTPGRMWVESAETE